MTESNGARLESLSQREERVIQLFQRQADQYLAHKPADNEFVVWLSIIQHFGGPTRLLDFTRSFYVAVFFALENAVAEGTVWAINSRVLDRQYIGRADLTPEGDHAPTVAESKRYVANVCIGRSFGRRVSEPPNPVQDEPHPVIDQPNVVAVEPWSLHQRMTVQQGLFLLPTALNRPFEENLCRGLDVPYQELPPKTPMPTVRQLQERVSESGNELALVRITIPATMRTQAIADLYRMNVTAATLFPGLDGFARSLVCYPFDDD
jgi:hypothetical protein